MNYTKMSKKKETKKNVIYFISWFFGVFFLFLSFAGLISSDFIPSLILLIMGLVLLPPINLLIKQKYNIHLSKKIKAIILIVGFLLIGISLDNQDINLDSLNESLKNSISQGKKTQNEEEIIQIDNENKKIVQTEPLKKNIISGDVPSKIATEWIKALIKGSGSEKVFNYLSEDAKSVYSSYDEWNDELYNIKYQWNVQAVFFTYLEIENEVINENNASVEVKYRAKTVIQKTVTQKYYFIVEDNKWKLKEYYELTI
jgi:hypothetical protein